MTAHKWGTQVPNGQFNPADVVEVFGEGAYLLMQDELGRLPILRQLAPNAFICLRFYLPNWFTTDAKEWARSNWQVLFQVNESDPQKRRNIDLIDAYTWANEQNLQHESGGAIGSAPGVMIRPGEYEIIRDWNMAYLGEIAALEAQHQVTLPKVFPALAIANSDDQDDGAGVGLNILRPVIAACQYGSIHPYWNADKDIRDEWVGLGRIEKQLRFFAGKPILVTETGNFAVFRDDAPDQYLTAGYHMQGHPHIHAFFFFIFADPTKQHQFNDMSRNPKVYDAIKAAVKTPRGNPVPVPGSFEPEPPVTPTPEPLPVPQPNLPPQVNAMKVMYQVWQYNAPPQPPQSYQELLEAMNACGATILTDKYSDSDVLQGTFDFSPMAVKSIQVMKDRKAWCEDNGFEYMPWDVPRAIPIEGDAFRGAREEAKFHASVCNEVGLAYRISDLEFYESFFGWSIARNNKPSVPYFRNDAERMDAAVEYYQTFMAESDTKTILQPDPRQCSVGPGRAIDLIRLKPYIHAYLPQSYAYWFMMLGDTRTHQQIMTEYINQAVNLGLPFGMCLYSEMGTQRDTPPDFVFDLLVQSKNAGAQWVAIYKAPVAPITADIIKEYIGLMPPSNDFQESKDKIWKLGVELEMMAVRAQELEQEVKAAGYLWMGHNLEGVSKALEGVALSAKASTKIPRD